MNKKINRDQPQMLIPALVDVSGRRVSGSGAVLGSTVSCSRAVLGSSGIQMSGEIATAEPQLSGGGITPPMSREKEHSTKCINYIIIVVHQHQQRNLLIELMHSWALIA